MSSTHSELTPLDQETAELSLSFEDALRELEGLVRRLEEGRLPLEDAIESYERGSILRRHCESILSKAQLKVSQVEQKEGNDIKIKEVIL